MLYYILNYIWSYYIYIYMCYIPGIILYIYYDHIGIYYILWLFQVSANFQLPKSIAPRGDQLPPGAALSAFAALRQVLGGPLGGGGPSEVQRCHRFFMVEKWWKLWENISVFWGDVWRCYMYVINMLRYVYRILEFVKIRFLGSMISM